MILGYPPTSLSLCMGLQLKMGLKFTVHFVQGGPGTCLSNSGLPALCHLHSHHLILALSSLPYGPEERGWCSQPHFPSSSGLRPSSLFPRQVAGVQLSKETCAFNSGEPSTFPPGKSSGGLSGHDLGRLLSTRLVVSLQQIFPQHCCKTSAWQTPAGLQALLSAS